MKRKKTKTKTKIVSFQTSECSRFYGRAADANKPPKNHENARSMTAAAKGPLCVCVWGGRKHSPPGT